MNSKYFVLKPRGSGPYANASRKAMLAYATEIQHVDPALSCNIQEWVDKEIFNIIPTCPDLLGGVTRGELTMISGRHKDDYPVPRGWNSAINDWIEGWGPNGKIELTSTDPDWEPEERAESEQRDMDYPGDDR